MAAETEFWERGYTIVNDLADARQLAFTKAAMEFSRSSGRMKLISQNLPQPSLEEYLPGAGEVLLLQCQPRIEALTGRELLPTCAVWRIYERGAQLLPHLDRGACEISASLTICSEPEGNLWPIHVRDLSGVETGIGLAAGSAIIYQGCAVPHWREPFAGESQFQIFLHYVLKDGEYASLAFDGRDGPRFG